jgi:hypothetical protein
MAAQARRPEDHSHGELRARFQRLPAPGLDAIGGRHDGAFPGPGAYALACRCAMAATGLAGWHGKRFDPPARDAREAHGVNLVHGGEAKPMVARIAPSLTDGRPALVCTYRPQETPPYRWVRDEFRRWDEETLLGLAFLDVPVLPRLGLPFVLRCSQAT